MAYFIRGFVLLVLVLTQHFDFSLESLRVNDLIKQFFKAEGFYSLAFFPKHFVVVRKIILCEFRNKLISLKKWLSHILLKVVLFYSITIQKYHHLPVYHFRIYLK